MKRGFPAISIAAGLAVSFFLIAASPQDDETYYVRKRRDMVETQLRGRDIKDPRVLEIMGRIPRHLFIGPAYRRQAYEDYPLPIDEGQTISQPYIVALMSQSLKLRPADRVLHI